MISLKDVRSFKHRINPVEEIVGRANFGYYVIRPISLYFTWIILQTGMSANQVTVLHLGMGILGSICLGFPGFDAKFLGVLALYVSYVLDNVDGEIARFRKQASISGKFLDTVAHTVVIPAMFLGLGIGTYFDSHRFEAILLGFLAGFCSLRFDILAMYTDAAQAAESNLDRDYEYYQRQEDKLAGTDKLTLQYISKSADNRLKRLVYAAFAFPGTLNIIALSLLADFTLSKLNMSLLPVRVSLILLYVYGTLVPIRRMITVTRIVLNHETERVYLKLSKLSQHQEANQA